MDNFLGLTLSGQLRLRFGAMGKEIEQGGELAVTSAGQCKGTPVMLLASDLISVRDYLRAHPENQPLIVVDGTPRVCNRLDVLDDLAAIGASLAVCGERGARADLDLLAERSSELWVWNREDTEELSKAEPFPAQVQPGDAFAGFSRSSINFGSADSDRGALPGCVCWRRLSNNCVPGSCPAEAVWIGIVRPLQRTLFNFLLAIARALFPLLDSEGDGADVRGEDGGCGLRSECGK